MSLTLLSLTSLPLPTTIFPYTTLFRSLPCGGGLEHRESEDGEGTRADEQDENERDGQPHLRLLRHESILRRGDRRVHSATSATRGPDPRGLGRGRTRA